MYDFASCAKYSAYDGTKIVALLKRIPTGIGKWLLQQYKHSSSGNFIEKTHYTVRIIVLGRLQKNNEIILFGTCGGRKVYYFFKKIL